MNNNLINGENEKSCDLLTNFNNFGIMFALFT